MCPFSFPPPPFGQLVFLLRGTEEFYFVKVQAQAANLADIQRGFGGHLMFQRVLAIEGHIPPGSSCFLASFGFYIAVGRNKRPFPSLGCKMRELNRKKIINLVLEILAVEFHELLSLKELYPNRRCTCRKPLV